MEAVQFCVCGKQAPGDRWATSEVVYGPSHLAHNLLSLYCSIECQRLDVCPTSLSLHLPLRSAPQPTSIPTFSRINTEQQQPAYGPQSQLPALQYVRLSAAQPPQMISMTSGTHATTRPTTTNNRRANLPACFASLNPKSHPFPLQASMSTTFQAPGIGIEQSVPRTDPEQGHAVGGDDSPAAVFGLVPQRDNRRERLERHPKRSTKD